MPFFRQNFCIYVNFYTSLCHIELTSAYEFTLVKVTFVTDEITPIRLLVR